MADTAFIMRYRRIQELCFSKNWRVEIKAAFCRKQDSCGKNALFKRPITIIFFHSSWGTSYWTGVRLWVVWKSFALLLLSFDHYSFVKWKGVVWAAFFRRSSSAFGFQIGNMITRATMLLPVLWRPVALYKLIYRNNENKPGDQHRLIERRRRHWNKVAQKRLPTNPVSLFW